MRHRRFYGFDQRVSQGHRGRPDPKIDVSGHAQKLLCNIVASVAATSLFSEHFVAIFAQAFSARCPRGPPAYHLLATLVATCLLVETFLLLAMAAAAVSKFSDTSLHSRFVWTSACPRTFKAGVAHLRVLLKSLPAQSKIDGEKASFTDQEVVLTWRRPLTWRAAHMWACRSLKIVDFQGGSGEWILSVAGTPLSDTAPPGVGSSAPSAGTSLSDMPPPRSPMASSSAPAGTPPGSTSQSGAPSSMAPPAFPRSPSLKILRGGVVLSESSERYALGKALGRGTFGKVWEATCPLLLDRRFAVKRFSAEDATQARHDAIEEAVIAERFMGVLGLAQLVDAFNTPRPTERLFLVYEHHGTTLHVLLESGWPQSLLLAKAVARGVLQGLQALHSAAFVHTDIKPENIFVEFLEGQPAGGHEPASGHELARGHEPRYRVVVGDLGSVEEVRKVHRNKVEEGKPLGVGSLWWRAPEIVFRDEGYGTPVDMWSFGLVLAEMAGMTFHKHHKTQQAYLGALLKQLGSPEATSLASLPLYPKDVKVGTRRPWPDGSFSFLGSCGQELLDAVLLWEPAARCSATEALQHLWFQEGRLRLVGTARSEGKRHAWNVIAGQMTVDVLRWLRADQTFTLAGLSALDVRFDKADKRVKCEEDRKWICSGFLGNKPPTSQLCNLALDRPVPLARLQWWAKAFKAVNADAFASLQAAALRVATGLTEKELGDNGAHFVATTWENWVATCGELCITAATNSDGSCWREPEHLDGGASVVHMGVTLFGRRLLVCQQGPGLEAVEVLCRPGSVYIGGLTGPLHEVIHQWPRPGESLSAATVPRKQGLGHDLSVTVMCRTCLFPHNRSRLRNTTPSPQEFFLALVESFRGSFAAHAFRLPSLRDVLHQVALAGGAADSFMDEGAPSGKRPRT